MIENEQHETASLDFKERLPGQSATDKIAFLTDVAALANAGGGHLLYGVAEKRDENAQPTGVAGAAPGIEDPNPGQAILRLENMLREGIEPRVPGCRFYPVASPEKGTVIVLQVPRSWLAPHMVRRDERQLFYTRNSAGNRLMEYREIRSAFLISETIEIKARRFLDERLGRIVADATPVPLLRGPRLVLHLLPISAFARTELLSPRQIKEVRADFRPGEYCNDYRLNLDGVLLLRPETPDGRRAYAQVFRTGIVETVLADLHPTTEQGVHCIRTKPLEDVLRELLARQFKGLEKLGVQPPVVLSSALLGAKGFHLLLPGDFEEPQESPIDRDIAVFPEELLETWPASADEATRRLLSALLLAGGYLGA